MRDYAREELYPNSKMLSSTQVLDFAKSPSDFYQKWVLGMDTKESPALHTGIAFGELYADRTFDYRAYCNEHNVPARLVEVIERAIKHFQPANDPEHKVLVEHKGWTFRVSYDDFYPTQKTIVEHKTSALKWTQEVVDTHAQVTLQEWAYWKKYNELPVHILNWIDTASGSTKLITTFKTHRTKTELICFEQQIIDEVIKNLEAENFTVKIY